MRSNAVISPVLLHTVESRGEVALILVLTPVSQTLHLECLLQDIIQTRRHYKVQETRVGHGGTKHTSADTAALSL